VSTMSGSCSTGEMRLTSVVDDSGNMLREGVVEVCVNNAWGAVCARGLGSSEIDVICNQQSGFTGVGMLDNVH